MFSHLRTGASVETLEKDSENIMELIKARYEEITSTIKVKVDNVPQDVSVTIKSRCSGEFSGGQEVETDSCNNVDLGRTVRFAAEIQARRCLNDTVDHGFTVSPIGLNQTLAVKVETICECPCEQDGHADFEADSPSCSGGNGDNACGVCFCHEGFSGTSCECNDSGQVDEGGQGEDPNGKHVEMMRL